MTTNIDDLIKQAIDEVIGIEGGYVFDPLDSGGETRWGCTALVARAFGYEGPMKALPRETAVEIYAANYYKAPRFDLIAQYSPKIAKELFEIEVNMPPGRAATFLQRALRALNDPIGKGTAATLLFPDVVVDGHIGKDTADALEAFLKYRKTPGEAVLLKLINSQQAVYFLERAEKRPANERYLYGWIANRVVI